MFKRTMAGTGALSAILVVALSGPGAGCRTEAGPQAHAPAKPPHDPWLHGSEAEKFHQVETQMRGLDIAMMEVGYRFTELYFAGKDRNWPYAKYQAEKIGHVIRLGIERRPKRAVSAQPFLAEDVPAILQAIDKRNDEVFNTGMERLRSSCMRCHVAEKLPEFTLEFPEHRISPIRTVR